MKACPACGAPNDVEAITCCVCHAGFLPQDAPERPLVSPPDLARPCLRCDGTLELGFVLDSDMTMMGVALWCPGEPDLSTLGKRREAARERERWRPIHALRCGGCGAIELFAPDPVARA